MAGGITRDVIPKSVEGMGDFTPNVSKSKLEGDHLTSKGKQVVNVPSYYVAQNLPRLMVG